MLRFWLKACTKCGGDLALDEGDWICLQCGTYYYVRLYPGLDQRHRPEAPRRSGKGPQGLPLGKAIPTPAAFDPRGLRGFDPGVMAVGLAAAWWTPGITAP